ncbi:hypothetical protein [uncultured Marinobacter sp.]|uniref:hypothetical protein n=1 Tax=uncultured Marinobacter sp. TaxID=187379 RepID=UPI002617E6B6|nr:hypothetical protein [uncultured Marinobacter sp.]
MYALTRALPQTIATPPRSSRKDLLALYDAPYTPVSLKGMRATLQWLDDLGFQVNREQQDHWVVTHTHPLPELHFYSEIELERFATGKAHHYAKRLLRETSQ